MWRVLSVVLLVLFLSPLAYSQTTVSGTITDSGGVLWKNGTYLFTFIPSPTNPNAQYFQNGVPFNKFQTVPVLGPGALDNTGSFTSVAVPDNMTITPSGSSWNLQICPAATATNGCFIRNLVITGASMNVTSSVIPPPVVVNLSNPLPGAAAYNDAEIAGARQGSVYFNLTDNSLHTCGGFPVCIWLVMPPTSGATGTVTSVSDGGFAPLFTTNVATPTTTPAITNTSISQNANNFYAGPSGTAIDLVDFAISTATGTASPISISATPKQSGDLAMVFSVRDNTGNAPAFTPDVSWTASSFNSVLQEYFYKNVSGTTTASASGAIGNTNPNWSAALALFTARVGFTPTLTNQANIISGAFSSFTNQAIGFTPTAGRTLIIAIMSGNTSFNLGPVGLVSFTDSVGDIFSPLTYVINNAGQGTEIILLAATGIAGGATTFSGSLTSATCPGCGIANGIVSVFEVTNLAPATPTFGPPTFRQIVGADLPRPTPVSVGGVFSKAAVANQFLTSVNVDGTISAAQPSFSNLSGTATGAQLPATTSNCTGNNFAQGLNAGFTPICAAAAVPIAVQVFSATTLGADVAVSATTQTTVMTRTVTMPSSGCPCRAFMSYSLYVNTASSGTGYSFWINDGSANMAGLNTGQSNASGGGLTSASFGGWSTATYANNANVTFTLLTEGDHTYTVKAASQLAGNAPNSAFQIAISTSN